MYYYQWEGAAGTHASFSVNGTSGMVIHWDRALFGEWERPLSSNAILRFVLVKWGMQGEMYLFSVDSPVSINV